MAARSQEQACQVVRGCLAERVPKVQQAGTAVLQSWLEQGCQGNLGVLLGQLDGLALGEHCLTR